MRISVVNFEFDDTLFDKKIINLFVEYRFPEFNITTTKKLINNCEKLVYLLIFQKNEKTFDIPDECPNYKITLESLAISHSLFSYEDAKVLENAFDL